MPVHNAAPFLHRGIQSVLDQPEVVELIAINDASTDHSGEILKLWSEKDDRIIVLHTGGTHPRGPSVARNMGIQKSSADFIAFLDADDYYLPGRFNRTKDWFNKNPQVDAVIERVVNIDKLKNKPPSQPFSFRNESHHFLVELLSVNGIMVHLNGLCLRSPTCSLLSFRENLFFAQDTIFFIDLALYFHCSSIYPSRVVAHRKLHQSNSIFLIKERKTFKPIIAKEFLSRMNENLPRKVNYLLLKRFLLRSCTYKHRATRYIYYAIKGVYLIFRKPIFMYRCLLVPARGKLLSRKNTHINRNQK